MQCNCIGHTKSYVNNNKFMFLNLKVETLLFTSTGTRHNTRTLSDSRTFVRP